MKSLMIKDLTANVELDSKAMTAVSGGLYLGRVRRPYFGGPKLSLSVTDIDTTSVIADQNLAQVTNVSTVFERANRQTPPLQKQSAGALILTGAPHFFH